MSHAACGPACGGRASQGCGAADAGPAAPQSPRCTIARNGSAAGPHLHPVRRVPFLVVDELAFLTAYPPERDLRKRAEAAIATLTS